MSEPNETDEITRELEAMFADYYFPPTEADLRGVDAATFALGLCYGFDSWQDVRVVTNSRRKVAAAKRHWAEQHPSREFLSHALGTDERALEHQRLLERAHPDCAECEELLVRFARASAINSDGVDPGTAAGDLVSEIEAWLRFQPVGVTRSDTESPEAAGLFQVPDRDDDQAITAEHMGGRDWRITIRDPGAQEATVHIRWTGSHESTHAVTFENDLAVIDAEAPEEGAQPKSLRIQVTGADE
jgi:hypothetical protein